MNQSIDKQKENIVLAANSQINQLKSADEIQLATTDTEMGKVSEELIKAYEVLESTYENDVDNIHNAATEFEKNVSDLKDKAVTVLSNTNGKNESIKEYQEYIFSGFESLEKYSEKLCSASNDDMAGTINKIKELVNPNKEVASLSDDLSFNDVTNEEIDSIEITEEERIASESNEDIKNTFDNEKISVDDLKVTNDTKINDKVREEFKDYESVLDVYQYIKNNYHTEFYYGSRKGAVGTFEQKSGNDYDIASLLIGILRDRNIPAKYVQSEIEITAEQAMEWTAAKVISALGIPVTTVSGVDGIESVRIEQVFVLAYVPYTDYRGTGN